MACGEVSEVVRLDQIAEEKRCMVGDESYIWGFPDVEEGIWQRDVKFLLFLCFFWPCSLDLTMKRPISWHRQIKA